LPFRQTRLREFSRPAELDHGCVVAESDMEDPLEARRNFLAVCLPEYSEADSCQNPFLGTRWLKKLLLLSTFTAWTAAAIAVAIALD
jgi:hypothetical protein